MTSAIDGDEDVREIRWSEVEDRFFVGSFRGNFVGYINHDPDGSFTCFDSTSRPRGEFTSLESAMGSLNNLYLSDSIKGEPNDGGH
ncbi:MULTISPECIES: hypothetical protein [Dietzia]|uniref:hypothetical protein n=1 Tax=Dietzia TaxID=37914 RepID=UPI001EE65904|nr:MULTISPECIES: hypothetical protein [Dietzia]